MSQVLAYDSSTQVRERVPSETHSPLDESGEMLERMLMIIRGGVVKEISLPTRFNFTAPDEFSGRFFTIRDTVSEVTAAQEESQDMEGSSAQERPQVRIDKEIESLFRAAEKEVFEDGMENVFSEELTLFVNRYGNVSLDIMESLLFSSKADVEVVAQALRSLGEMHHPPSRDLRRSLIEKGLRQSSPWVRDGAVLGLAWLDDPAAIPSLTKAVQQEQIDELRRDMGKVLSQLERTR